ncbi:hypothetical protein DFH08DRAFT_719028 [Mycena albidolilacea]|uniref:NADH:flavin oxidoreductase/NADH oxidase N-terminal domain-containing protein n=1 Tax=Mycena albidolilacea TaxID=1033008 RepID=A0AAD6Z6B5_9AGAR|nr:hypothetical protein DFH08DRAFT_719028 [Mycena albidolilacea]
MTVLFTPLDVGDITFTNRIGECVLPADTKRVPNNVMKNLQRALSGAGLILTEATLILSQGAQYDRSPGIWNMEQVAEWRKITNMVHLTRNKIYCQIRTADAVYRVHFLTSPSSCGMPVYGPSAIPARAQGNISSFHELRDAESFFSDKPNEVPDPTILIKLFKATAKNAKLAGFDGVEYKLDISACGERFPCSPVSGWGRDGENCARFGPEVLKLLVVFGCNVSLKISLGKSLWGGYNDIGMHLDDTAQTFSYFLSEADKLKSLYIMLSQYIPHLDPMIDGKERGTPHDPVSTYAKLIHNAKTFVVGGVTPEEAEELAKTGEVNGAFFGMSWLTHPDLAKRIQHSKRIDNMAAMSQLYGDANVDPCLGYTNSPAVTY